MSNNKELNKYFNILCNNDYPEFINKYLKTIELNRLKYIDFFCGCYYTKIYNIKYFYSRLDHSIAVSLITWNFTKDKSQTLAALFHDLGTPVFSHTIDFMLGDTINQETSEKSVFDIIKTSLDIKKLLIKDSITIEEVSSLDNYSIIENKSPKLCADRLDGVLSTVLIWLHTWSLEQIEKVYKEIVVLNNENNNLELGFRSIESSVFFFKAVMEYSMVLQKNENKYVLQYIADAIKELINNKYITIEDLYKLKDIDILNILENTNSKWNIFRQTKEIIKTDTKPSNVYSVSLKSKKRCVIPLCSNNDIPVRLDKVSSETKKTLIEYNNYKDTKYSYIPNI